MKSPLALAAIVFFASSAMASCDISGDWSKDTYSAGDVMRFEGDIDPSSGFIYGYIENPLGDKVAEIPLTQIDTDFELVLRTSDAYLNGTYTAKVYYDQYPNGSDCDDSVSEDTELETSNTRGDLVLNITINQSFATQPIDVEGAPVETDLGRITSRIIGYGTPGLVPSIKLMGTQLVAGSGIGDIDIQMTMCPTNDEIMNAYKSISAFLTSNYTDVLSYERENSRLETENAENAVRIDNLTATIAARSREIGEWKGIAGGKMDWWMAIPLMFMGGFALILLQWYDQKHRMGEKQPPLPLDSKGVFIHG